MIFSKNSKVFLFCFLVILNIVLRLQPHFSEIGLDSFFIHIMSNSLVEFGKANWVYHPLSFFGIYPYSYSSATQFIFAGISLVSGVSMKSVVLIVSFIFGIISMLVMYLFAGALLKNDIFKFFASFMYSTSQAILAYTTFTIPARGFFVVIVPLSLFLLLKIKNFCLDKPTNTKYNIPRINIKFAGLFFIFLVFLFSVHHLMYFLIPPTLIFMVLLFYEKVSSSRHTTFRELTKKIDAWYPFVIFIGVVMAFSVPFIGGKFLASSRYDPVFMGYLRYLGLTSIFLVSGFVYLSVKSKSTFQERFLVLSAISLIPFIYKVTYLKWFLPVIGISLASFGLLNLLNVRKFPSHKLLSIVLVLFVMFSGYYQFIHEYDFHDRAIDESTFQVGSWTKKHIEGNVISNDYWQSLRIASSSSSQKTHMLVGSTVLDQIYGFVQPNFSEFERRSIFSEEFYRGSYEGKDIGEHNWVSLHRRQIEFSSFNITSFVESVPASSNLVWGHQAEPSLLLRKTLDNNSLIYDNGLYRIWSLNV